MKHNIHPSLVDLAISVDLLVELPDNPRTGNVPALMESYTRFGQLKPIVVRSNDDGTYTVMSGNHQLEAAVELGWTHLACTPMDSSVEEAVAFAMIENRWGELGDIDKSKLHDHIVSVWDEQQDMFALVGWDDFEVAAIGLSADGFEGIPSGRAGGYEAPEIITPAVTPEARTDGDNEWLAAPAGTDEKQAVVAGVGGATSQSDTPKKSAAQYTLMFDDAAQMGRWWDFIRFLRSSPVYEGETIAARLMMFVEAHGEF